MIVSRVPHLPARCDDSSRPLAATFHRMRRFKPRRPSETTDTRPPEARLEAMVREPNRDRALRMLDRIRAGLGEPPEPAPWIAAARTLSERLIISENTFYYLASLFAESLIDAAAYSDPELTRLSNELQTIERAYGLKEDEGFLVSDAPPDWSAVNQAWEQRADRIVADYLRASRNADLASMLEAKREELERRSEAGYDELWGLEDEDEEGEDY